MRDFTTERKRQLHEEQLGCELNRAIDRFFPQNTEEGRLIREIYGQNPLLRLLLNAAKTGKSPYTEPVHANHP